MREQRRKGKILTPTLGRRIVTDMGDVIAIREATDGSWVAMGRAQHRGWQTGRRVRQMRPVRDIDDGFGNLLTVQFCSQCRRWKPLRVPFFSPHRRDAKRRVVKWDNWCVECRRPKFAEYDAKVPPDVKRERIRQRDERIRQNPERRERLKEIKRRSERRRAEIPEVRERRRERRRARYAAMRSDPARYAKYLENRRMDYRIKQEREGRTVTKSMPAGNPYRESTGAAAAKESHPLLPFALWVDAVLEGDRREFDEIASAMDIPERRLYGYRTREGGVVALASADRAIWRYGKAVQIPVRVVEAELARLEAFWRSSPGNGERILGYLDAAEQIAHLAGVVVDRVEDLWELDAK